MARVIVIEDDVNMRHLIATVLRADGHVVATAAEGGAGLKAHAAEPAELVVTDIFMPGMEGLETIREFRKTDQRVRILAITGMPDLGNPLAIAARFGANRTLEKPFQPHELLAAVRETLRPAPVT